METENSEWAERVVLAFFKYSTKVCAATDTTHSKQYLKCKCSRHALNLTQLVMTTKPLTLQANSCCSIDGSIAEEKSLKAEQKKNKKRSSALSSMIRDKVLLLFIEQNVAER